MILKKQLARLLNEDGTPSTVTRVVYVEVPEELNAKEGKKEEALRTLTVTTASGKVFYADQPSRIDLRDAIAMGEDVGQTETMWKLAEPYNGSRVVMVTVDELKEASKLALETKGQLVGAL